MGSTTFGPLDVRTGLWLCLEHVRNLRGVSAVRQELGRHAMSGLPTVVSPCGLVSWNHSSRAARRGSSFSNL